MLGVEMEFPYTTVPANLVKFLEHIQKVGIPKKVTQQYLEAQGFKSTNDRSIIRVLKSIGFLGTGGEPTAQWQAYRHRENAGKVMAGSLRTAYATLFDNYPDAHRRDNEALRNFFSAHTDVGDDALNLIVRTFKSLADLGDFNAFRSQGDRKPDSKVTADKSADTLGIKSDEGSGQGHGGMVVNINIQLTLPETNDPKVYESFFQAMAWAAFMDFFEEKLASDGMRRLRSSRPRWVASTMEDLREEVAEHQLISAARDVGLCRKNEVKALHGMLNKRNECAHPSDYFPDMNDAVGFIGEVLKRIAILQPRAL